MIVVTGGAGFIGSNIIRGLNRLGHTNILLVDDMTDGRKFKNIADCEFWDYMDKEEFMAKMKASAYFQRDIKFVFHQGACSDTTEWDGKFMMYNNYEYSKLILLYCIKCGIPFIYASSASVYGDGKVFKESPEYEKPLNLYAYSKFQFDQYVRAAMPTARIQLAGLRYFNVYGPREFHKGTMASVAFHNHNQLIKEGAIKLFEGCDGYGNGEQRRDFVYVDDVVDVNLWFFQNPDKLGIFNVGTGKSQSFNDVSRAVIDWHKKGNIEYIPFPEHLVGHYQSFTEADISALRAIGYEKPFKTVEEGVTDYLNWLKEHG